ncbi:MAG: hypothetical protein Crog4KO_26570 [Crocinitomicaceae bacterium]
MAKKKKYTLELDDDLEFDLVGICSHHSDYRLAWGINQELGLQLSKCDEPYCVTDRKGTVVSTHSMYEYTNESDRVVYYLIKNKHQGKYLIPEKPSIDFFLFLCDNWAVEISELMAGLKVVSSVLAVYPFDPDELKSAENIVF